jgi:hypothetical protein
MSHLTAGWNIFPRFLLTVTIFRRKIFYHKMCVLIFSKTFLWNIFIIRKVNRELIKNIHKSSCQRAVFLIRFTRNQNFPDMFEKYSSTKFRKIPSMPTDGQTDMTKLIVAFRNLTHLTRSLFFIFSQTQKVSITQVRNFVETRLLAVALNQADGKQRSKIFTICYELPNTVLSVLYRSYSTVYMVTISSAYRGG